jgi:hypothetical protein
MKVQAWMAVAAAVAATVVFPAARADDGAAQVEAPMGDASIEVETPVAMADACAEYTNKRRCNRKGKKAGLWVEWNPMFHETEASEGVLRRQLVHKRQV